ncbi:hypothetical protein [Streptomyces sp. NPDC056479]|uniref:hypothetical protein n=1 Tax=unclassified Streptomyces TaxID=2593676 RepID=UPI0036B44B7C
MGVATKKLAPEPGIKLGSRKERREVYRTFLDSVCEALAFADLLREEKQISGLFISRTRSRQLLQMMHERRTGLIQAYFEMRLVASPEPLHAAEEALAATSEAIGAAGGDAEAYARAVVLAMEAQRAFTDACRVDLGYELRWWQWRRRQALKRVHRLRAAQLEAGRQDAP